jgi:hypothetical protein
MRGLGWWALAGCATGCTAETIPLDPASVTTRDGIYRLHLALEPSPPAAGVAVSLSLEVQAGGASVEGAQLDIEPWMPAHDHGLTGTLVTTERGDGGYLAEWIFPMAGYWEVRINIDGDAGEDDATVAYEVE